MMAERKTVLEDGHYLPDGTDTAEFTSGHSVMVRPLQGLSSQVAVFDTEGEIYVGTHSVRPKDFENRLEDALADHGGDYHALLESSSAAVVESGRRILDTEGE